MPKASCLRPMPCCIPGCRSNCNGNSINWTRSHLRCACPCQKIIRGSLTWQHWYWSYERPKPAPALRLILIWDNLKGHLSYSMVRWLLQRGILPLYTPLSGSWLNMAESLQRIIVRRALAGQHPQSAKPSHRLVGANRGWLEQASDLICVEWQAPTAA